MTIKNKIKKISSKNVRDSLTLACCSLLHTAPNVKAELLDDVKVDSAVLIYSESDGRVSLIEPIVKIKTELGEDEFLNIQLVFDTLTGATPTGAQATNVVQTFTKPSGSGTYTIQPGETPLDDTFKDTRVAISASLEKPIDRLSKNIYSAAFSTEYDWRSLSAGYTYSKDSKSRDTTYTIGASLTSDAISPVGGAPIAFALMQDAGDDSSKSGDESRSTIDLIAGLTKVLNRKTITQFNYSYSQSNGYHSDPYKLLSVMDDATGELAATAEYRYESRPDSRQRHILYWKTAHHLTEDVINIAYRYYQDDWGINSHTVDLKYRYELSDKNFLQPHIRFYSQSAADFYRHSLLASETNNLPEFASPDLRLAEFNTVTVGLKYGHKLGANKSISGRIEIMQQTGSQPADAVGEQLNQDLHPDLSAIILQLSYSFVW
jgi:Protein of unknown function (DUF3570)